MSTAFLASGCGTITTWNDSSCKLELPFTYRGTAVDAMMGWDLIREGLGHGWPLQVLYALDLPLSLIGDTLALPVAIFRDVNSTEECK